MEENGEWMTEQTFFPFSKKMENIKNAKSYEDCPLLLEYEVTSSRM